MTVFECLFVCSQDDLSRKLKAATAELQHMHADASAEAVDRRDETQASLLSTLEQLDASR